MSKIKTLVKICHHGINISNFCEDCKNLVCLSASSERIKKRLSAIKHKCKKFNIPFDLDVTDITVPEFCPVLGIPIEYGTEHVTNNSPSVDRIIPELGYVKGNVVVVSHRANRLKFNATIEEIVKVAKFYSQFLTN